MKVLESSTRYDGKVLKLLLDRIELPSGRSALREVVHFPKTVTVIPLIGESVVLVRQERYPARETLLELPAGKMEAGESPEETARRELEEETGYRSGSLEEIQSFFVSPGYSTEFMRLFIASELIETEASPDSDEILEPMILPLNRAREMLVRGELRDAKTILGLACFFLRAGR
jgi:ADP-ribose pyrophosphatase